MQHPQRPGEDVRSPETGARAACELPRRPWDLNTGPPKEEPVLLTPESFLQGLISNSSQGLRFGRGGGASHAHFILENTVQKCLINFGDKWTRSVRIYHLYNSGRSSLM